MKFFARFGIIMASLLVASCGGASKQPLPDRGEIALSAAFNGQYDLVDEDGNRATPDRFSGKPVLIYFGFTSCPDVCPSALNVMSAALNELGGKANSIQPLFIALDADRDTPKVVKDYLAFDPRIVGLTGDKAAIEKAKAGFKVYAERQDLPGSALGYTLAHSSLFYLVDRQGQPQFAYLDQLTPQQLAGFLRRHL